VPTDEQQAIEDPHRLLAALHRFYLETLPYGQQAGARKRADPRAVDLDVGAALQVIAGSRLAPMVKAHLVASALKRNPALVNDHADQLATLVESADLFTEPRMTADISESLRVVARSFASQDPPPVEQDESPAPGHPRDGEKGAP
jgi:hypothetical protein